MATNNTRLQQAAAAQAAPAQQKKACGLKSYLDSMKPAIKAALPSVITPERFTRICNSALSSNAALQQCTPQSFLGAMMTAAQLGLEPNTPLGQAYLIPFRNNRKGGVMECQFQIGYKGLIDLAYRSGSVSLIMAQTVYENDEFTYSFGLEPELKHIPARSNRGAPVLYYAMFRTKDGAFGYEVMSAEDIRKHAVRYSKSFNSGPWQTNFDEMAKKTVLKRVLKYAPLRSDFVRDITSDETVRTEISPDMYDVPTEYISAEYETVDEAPAAGDAAEASDNVVSG